MTSRTRSSTTNSKSLKSKAVSKKPIISRETRSEAASTSKYLSSTTTISRKRSRSDTIVEVVIERTTKKRPREIQHEETTSTVTEKASIDIGTLPNEIFVDILGLLSRKERKACRLICKKWDSKILSAPTLWKDPPPIKGSLSGIVERMTGSLSRLSGGGQYTTLSLVLDPEYDGYEDYVDDEMLQITKGKAKKRKILRQSALAECFPLSTLRELICRRINKSCYDGAAELDSENIELWHCVTLCSKLKVLQWWSMEGDSSYPRSGDRFHAIDFCLEDKPLAKCRLEEFTFDVPYEFEIDQAFLGIIGQVKVLDMNARFDASQLESIFDTIKDSVEEFTFTNFTDEFPGWDEFDAMKAKMLSRTIAMPNLRKYHAAFSLVGAEYSRCQLPSPYQIIAPRVTSLSFARLNSIDWVLLESCRSTLESFCVGTGGKKLPDRLQQELFNMPSLLELSLDFTNDGTSDYRCADEYFFTQFWESIGRGDTQRRDISIEDILPKLKSLTLIDDTKLTYKRIIGLLELRHRLGLTAIESLTIWFEFRKTISKEEIAILRTKFAKLEIKEDCNLVPDIFCDQQCNRNMNFAKSRKR